MSRVLDSAGFDALFAGAASSAERVESHPYYRGNDDDVTAWRLGAYVGRTPETSPYLAEVSGHDGRGVDRVRLRVVSHDLTEYERWELHALEANDAYGEHVYVASPSHLSDNVGDFWLFDRRTVVLMHYDDAGTLVWLELVTDPQEVADYCWTFDVLARVATPLGAYRARRAG